MEVVEGSGAPEVDVHICVVMEGESLYIPDTISRALGLSRGGSYVIVRVNDMAVIAPRSAAAETGCTHWEDEVRRQEGAVGDVLARVEAARSELAARAA
jgi:hypothetical protein